MPWEYPASSSSTSSPAVVNSSAASPPAAPAPITIASKIRGVPERCKAARSTDAARLSDIMNQVMSAMILKE